MAHFHLWVLTVCILCQFQSCFCIANVFSLWLHVHSVAFEHLGLGLNRNKTQLGSVTYQRLCFNKNRWVVALARAVTRCPLVHKRRQVVAIAPGLVVYRGSDVMRPVLPG